MRRWVLGFFSALVLPCPVQGFAQQAGPRTLEALAQTADAENAPAVPEAEAKDVGPKRPAGTLVRPKEGVKHPDLDKAWADYDAAVSKAAESIRAAINKQFDAATAKGDLDAAEKWQAALEKFEKSGEVPTEKETKATVSAMVVEYKKAREELTKAYEFVVKSLTIEKKIAEAKAVRGESAGLTSPILETASKDQLPLAVRADQPGLIAPDKRAVVEKAEAVSRLAKGLRPESRYKGMLGRFISAARRGQPADANTFNTPYIFLHVPSGDNVLAQRVQTAFQNHPAGQPTFGHLWFNFVTEGKFELMQDTTVVIKAGGACGIILDGKDVTPPGYEDRALSFELARGLHTVVLYSGHNGGQLGRAFIALAQKNGKPISPWFTGQDFEDFVRRFEDSHEVVEVSGWSAR